MAFVSAQQAPILICWTASDGIRVRAASANLNLLKIKRSGPDGRESANSRIFARSLDDARSRFHTRTRGQTAGGNRWEVSRLSRVVMASVLSCLRNLAQSQSRQKRTRPFFRVRAASANLEVGRSGSDGRASAVFLKRPSLTWPAWHAFWLALRTHA